MFSIAIVGLGLIGGSVAMAAKGFMVEGQNIHRIGIDKDQAVLARALQEGSIDEIGDPSHCEQMIAKADLIVLCLYPQAAIDFVKQYAHCIKEKVVVTDVCGVKGDFVEQSARLLPQASYVGGHPMAGRELSGYSAAVATLFKGCNYIITPSDTASASAVTLVQAFAMHIGASRITYADPATHDRNIAYTSQLAHVLAAAVVQNPALLACEGFAGGSLADITRVAKMNSTMWSQLFCLNKEYLTTAVLQLEQSLAQLRQMIEQGDTDALQTQLEHASQCKEKWAASVM